MVIAVFFTAFIVFNGLWAWKYLSGSTEWNELDDKLADLNKETQGYQKSIKRLSTEKKRWDQYMKELKERNGDESGEDFDPFIRVRNMDHWKGINPSSPRRSTSSEESGFDSFEKIRYLHVSEKLESERIDAEHMDEKAGYRNRGEKAERHQYFISEITDNDRDQRKHADRGDLHDYHDHFYHGIVQSIKESQDRFRSIFRQQR